MTKRKTRIDRTCVCMRYIASPTASGFPKKTVEIPVQASDEDVVRVVPVTLMTKAAAG